MKTITARLEAHSRSAASVVALAAAVALLGSTAQAQSPTPNLFLTSSSTTAGPNATVTIFLNLIDGADDTAGLGKALTSFDTNVSFSNSSLTFTSLFTKSAASPFSDQLTDTKTASSLRTSFQVPFSNPMVDATGQTILLGSFQVMTGASGLPAAGTFVQLGSPTVSVNSGGSELINGSTFMNVLRGVTPVKISPAAAPEPSGLLALAMGPAGLGLMAWRRRRAA